jgi:hypothetical protein
MNKVLCLRTCDANRRGYGCFQWPESGPVEAPDWSAEPCCGKGLHGLLWGEGDAGHLSAVEDAVWMVVEVDATAVVDLRGKVKFPRGEVVYCGMRDEAVAYILAHGGAGRACAYARVTAGDEGTATAGYRGTATAGDRGTATAGDRGTATAGYRGTATAGDEGTVCVHWYDGTASRYRLAVGYVGEDGIEANVPYRVEGRGVLVCADK